jgi:hypothetical protein
VRKVLVANIPLPGNRFLVDLNAGLSRHCEVTHSSDEFWDMRGDYDVVHLHFPEYMTFEMQSAYREGLSEDLRRRVEERLRHWADRSRIVVTRHVLLPHDAVHDPRWEEMYETVYSHADGVVHFANASVEEFGERYARTRFYRGHMPEHAVIPHQNYASLPSGITRAEARRKLGIRQGAAVMLAFGAIRSRAESDLVMNTFRGLDVKGKVLLASRWREEPANVSWIRLQRWIRNAKRLWYRVHPAYRFNYSFVSEEDTQDYLAACDVLFIPRLRVLNSGNIALGMTFGRVVAGPDSWDVGEILRATGNPVFDPGHPETAREAVTTGFRLAAEGATGEANRRVALEQWDSTTCADSYFRFFEHLTSNATLTSFTT